MNILYLGYWGVAEGLTAATILPHLKILSEMEGVDKVVYCSIERSGEPPPPLDLPIHGLKHVPLVSQNLKPAILNKIWDFNIFKRQLLKIVKEDSIDYIICRTALAGSLGYLVHRKTDIPFSVESFEPHAEYMRNTGVWSQWDPRYKQQVQWEKRQKKFAHHLLTVSAHYASQLKEEGVSEDKIHAVPCAVNPETFDFRAEDGHQIRKKLGFEPEDIVGIYVGKLGGIYLDEEAYQLFASAREHFNPHFRLIILNNELATIGQRLIENGFEAHEFWVNLVQHHQVPGFLSASNFAFSLHRPTAVSQYLSPIKNGEYWASGLPILIPDNIGDDSDIVRREGGGVIFNLQQQQHHEAFQRLDKIIKAQKRPETRNLAIKHRSFDTVKNIYQKILPI